MTYVRSHKVIKWWSQESDPGIWCRVSWHLSVLAEGNSSPASCPANTFFQSALIFSLHSCVCHFLEVYTHAHIYMHMLCTYTCILYMLYMSDYQILLCKLCFWVQFKRLPSLKTTKILSKIFFQNFQEFFPTFSVYRIFNFTVWTTTCHNIIIWKQFYILQYE